MVITTTPATLLIIAITAIVSYACFGNHTLRDRLLFIPTAIKRDKSQLYRFISHGFIHADTIHLFFNMITLFFFGPTVEKYLNIHYSKPLGSVVYLGLYLISIIASTAISYFRNQNNTYYRSLGASGAVSAILFASILIYPQNEIFLFFIPIEIPAFVFGPLYLIYTVYMDKKGKDNIGHDAHFMGAIFGLIAIVLLVPDTFGNFIKEILTLFNS